MKSKNFWLINPKSEGPDTDLSTYSLDSVYMGWNSNDCPKFYNEVKSGDVIIVTTRAHYNTEIRYIGIADKLYLNDQCWTLLYSTTEMNKEVANIIQENPSDFGGRQSSNPWGPTRSIIKIKKNNAELRIKDLLGRYFDNKYKQKHMEDYNIVLRKNYNLILTGAPGTGKTYLAKQIAQQMIFGEIKEEMSDDEKKLLEEHCGFVQFHPSYDYTDFVEGLRPVQNDDGIIGFERKDGVFKEFCKLAISKKQMDFGDYFNKAWNKLISDIRDGLSNGSLTKIGKWDFGLSSKETLKYSSVNTPSQYSFTITKDNVYDAYCGKIARKSGGYQKDILDVVEYLKKQYGLPEKIENRHSNYEKYVFIIDEINRGEISKIFGELFFSIDPGYRGSKGKVKTQYQNLIEEGDEFYDGFYVPDNVYIIGTMNDIDRSVESMDFAFRRRFAFKEVTAEESQGMFDAESAWGNDNDGKSLKPDEKTIEAIKGRMNSLNKLIWHEPKKDENDDSKSLDGLSAAYHIGASYFLKLINYKKDDGTYNYKKLWDYHLEGLLREYLRGMHDIESSMNRLKDAYGYNKDDNNNND